VVKSKLGEGRKAFTLVETTMQVAPNGGVQESANSSAPREATKNLLADLESPRNLAYQKS